RGEAHLHLAQGAVAADVCDRADAVLLVPHRYADRVTVAVIGTLPWRDARVGPAFLRRRAAAAPVVDRLPGAGAAGRQVQVLRRVGRQLVEEHARHRVQRLAAELAQPGVAQVQFLL